MAGVTLNEVRKVYSGGVEAVKGVSFEVPDGAFCVLVGPSGCGKSTLLRMVAGIETISSGTISIGDRVVNDIEPSERDIAMVFQNYALYPHMNVYNNMAYGLRNRGTPKPEIETRVREAARILAPGGRLLIVDFAPHDIESLRDEHAHERLGFEQTHVSAWLEEAGLEKIEVKNLEPEKHDDRQQLTVSLWLGRKPQNADTTRNPHKLERIGS